MDREIPKEVRKKERNQKIMKVGGIGAAIVVCMALLISFMQSSVKRRDLVLSTVDNGTIEVSVSASGKVVPAFEEIINSPINSRIVEVYCKGGDSVDVGTPILKLDLQSTETAYKKLLDQEQMKRLQLEQLRVSNQTSLSNMAMNIKVSAMELSRKEVELRNERYLDSIGSGTTDKVRQAELAYNRGALELEQLRQQYENEKQVKAADLKVKELEFSIFTRELAEMKRTLDDAQIRSPRKATLTFVDLTLSTAVLLLELLLKTILSEAKLHHLQPVLPSVRASLVAQMVKILPAMQEMQVRSLGQEDTLEKGMATHSSIFCLENLMDRGA